MRRIYALDFSAGYKHATSRGNALMSDLIVCKFGGSSVVDAGQIEKVRQIIPGASAERVTHVNELPENTE